MKEEIEGQETLLEERKRLFEEECEKFSKYMENEQTKTSTLELQTKELISTKMKLISQIQLINRKIQEAQSDIYKIDDQLDQALQNKKFLDEV